MKKSCISSIALLVGLFSGLGYAQQANDFNLDLYRQFLESHSSMTAGQLLALHDAGKFRADVATNVFASAYFDSVKLKYNLTGDEISLLEKNGFVVTERLSKHSFGAAFADVYHKDVPVFISTDAILHSIHMAYDAILLSVEEKTLVPELDSLLAAMHMQLPLLAMKYAAYPEMKTMLRDVDVYLTVPRWLLDGSASPVFAENLSLVDSLLQFVSEQKVVTYPLFSSTPRKIDFSQFTPRGHYTQSLELTRYFKAMIWLGRIELYLTSPKSWDDRQTDADIQRETIDALLVKELAEAGNTVSGLGVIDDIMKCFVGESDNVTLPDLDSVTNSINLQDAHELLDTTRWREFQDTLLTRPFAFQRILSQLLEKNPMDPARVEPASAFLLLGQRFIVDSYIMGNVVYDRIGAKRMLPSPLDVLFAVGNNAAAQLLKPELDAYGYSSNLAALRYLIDSYGEDFWSGSIYNGWLNSIRALNPPSERDTLPRFMRTAAWWQEKMNTQLASWAQLRHDNLLYAKQSYTPWIICSYPEGYVEPVPAFYDEVKSFADAAFMKFRLPPFNATNGASYFHNLRNVADTLGSISRKELSGALLSDAEKGFLHRVLYDVNMCGLEYDGWYTRLFLTPQALMDSGMVVADVHTSPTDDLGGLVGWVLHVGTGPVNMAIVTAELPGGGMTTFVGPVMSYYEHVSTNFKRLTDEEWKTIYALSPSLRPSFENIYLADEIGALSVPGPSLLTGMSDRPPAQPLPKSLRLSQNYPNPFNSTTIISFVIPTSIANHNAEVNIYNVNGQLVKCLLYRELPAGNYTVRWDGRDAHGSQVASGVYLCRLSAAGVALSRKIVLLR